MKTGMRAVTQMMAMIRVEVKAFPRGDWSPAELRLVKVVIRLEDVMVVVVVVVAIAEGVEFGGSTRVALSSLGISQSLKLKEENASALFFL